jgi:hypothetical protein
VTKIVDLRGTSTMSSNVRRDLARACADRVCTGLLAAFASCGGAEEAQQTTSGPTQPWFIECAAESGVRFQHRSGHAGRYYFPEIMTSGAALFDADGDDDLDLYLVQGGSVLVDGPQAEGNALYLNRGDGTFVDATASSGAGDRGYGMGAATGDYDGDGDVDLYVTNLGRNTLLRNEGAARFTDVTDEAGVGGELWSTGAAFVDYDGDGDLDLFVANYLYWRASADPVCRQPSREPTYCGPTTYESPTPDTLFRNDGNGRFTDVSVATGIHARRGNGLGVLVADFDLDGRPEIFVANDGSPNHLWCWKGDGTFEECAGRLGCAVDNMGAPKAGMGVAAADLDADGDEDLLVVNLGGESDSYFRNERGRFSERAAAAGLALRSRERTRFGVGLFDFEHDGLLDCFQANGRVFHQVGFAGPDPFAEHDVVLRGIANGRFERIEPPGDFDRSLLATSRAAAFGDLDGDGDVDVVVHNKDGPAFVLRNVAPKLGGWVVLRCIAASGAPALGAAVDVQIGDRSVRHEVRTSSSYCAASTPDLHIGLGAAARIDEVRVRWPGGAVERFGPLPANHVHRLSQGAGR